MTLLWIILGSLAGLILLLLLFLLLGKAKFHIAASADRVKVMISLWGYHLWILPTEKGILKRGKKSKLLQKLQDSRNRSKIEKKVKQEAGIPTPTVLDNLELILRILKIARGKLNKKLKICVNRFHIEIASPDAAQTAILYGSLIGVISIMWEWIQTNIAEVERKPGQMQVIPNYQKTIGKADIDITFKMRGLKAMFVFFELMDTYKDEKKKTSQKAAARKKAEASKPASPEKTEEPSQQSPVEKSQAASQA